ncbi:hypothetical protein [Rhizobium sp.]|uniref:hypothetical protein n=1 Tax=Rhizobium sp. TaxID=391 RepID=UPI0028AA383D
MAPFSALAFPVASWFIHAVKIAAMRTIMTVIFWVELNTNIERLIAGTESKIGSNGQSARRGDSCLMAARGDRELR